MLAERGVVRAFGVPLDAEVEPAARVVDGLDDAVVGCCEGAEVAGFLHGLAVLGVGRAGCEDGLVDRVDVVGVLPVVGVGRVGLGEVLVEHAAGEQAHHLHAEADAEDGGVRVVVQGVEEVGLEGLAILEDADGLRVGRVAEGLGDGIVAAGEDECVEALDEALGGAWDWREDDGNPTRVEHGSGVGHGGEGRRAVVADHEVGGDRDEWALVWHGVIVGHLRSECARTDDTIETMSLRTILIWCIIAGLLGGAAVVIRDRSAAASATTEVRWAGLEFDPAGVTTLRIASGDDSAVIERDTQSVGAWQGRWDIRDESTAWSITPTRVRGALRMLSTGQVRLSEEPLVESGTLVELALRDGSGVELTIGTDRSGGRAPARITRRDESGAIERVQHGWMESGIADALNAQSTLAWRDTSLITAAMSSVTGVAVTAGPYASELRLVGSRWRLVEPIEVHANRERTETLIRTVLGLKAEGFVEQAIDQAASGLERPLAEIRLSTRDGVYTLRIGQAADVGGDSLYAEFSTGDSSTLIRVATSSLSKLTAAPDAYVGTVASAGASTDVSGVRVLGPG